MIGPTDLFHPSPAPHFKTFQVFLICCPKRPSFSTMALSHNGKIFGKKLPNIKCVFWFYLQRLRETCIILRRIQRDIFLNVRRSSAKVPLLLSDIIEKNLSAFFFEKQPNIKFYEKQSSVRRGFPSERTDRHDEAVTAAFPQFFERAWKRVTNMINEY